MRSLTEVEIIKIPANSVADMLGHKASLNKFQKTEIISSIFSDHNGIKLEINNRRKIHKYVRLNNVPLNKQ